VDTAFLMNVMDVESTVAVDLNIARVLRQLSIHLGLVFPPVEVAFPALCKTLNIAKRHTILPASPR